MRPALEAEIFFLLIHSHQKFDWKSWSENSSFLAQTGGLKLPRATDGPHGAVGTFAFLLSPTQSIQETYKQTKQYCNVI